MKKLLLITALSLMGLLAATSANAQTTIASGYCGGEGDGTNITWTFKSNNTLTLEGTGKMKDFNVPENLNVSEVPWSVDVEKVIIGDGITTIGNNAFANCFYLTSAIISNSVTMIGSGAFRICWRLTSITIPNSVTIIGDEAFLSCTSLTSVTIPPSVTTIGDEAFLSCTGLTSVTIPPSVTTIGKGVFLFCMNIKSADVDTANPRYSSINGIVYNKAQDTLLFCLSWKNTVTIPDSVTTIGSFAFYMCVGLRSVTIPNSVTTIGNAAFYGCDSLTSATIPNSVIIIGDSAFYHCAGLPSAIIPNSVNIISSYAFFGCSNLGSVTIPNSVTTIGSYAFYDCRNLDSVTIPNSVTSIGNRAFYNCISLTNLTLNSQPTIGNEAFDAFDYYNRPITLTINCDRIKRPEYYNLYLSNLKNLIIGDSAKIIQDSAFSGYSSIINLIIGNSVNTIGNNAFSGCYNLNSLTIPNFVTTIGNNAFSNCSGLTSLTIPNSVNTIGNNAFSNCSGLTSLTIPNSVNTIGNNAFSNCSGLTSLTIPNSITTIEENTFSGCSGLISLTIPNSVDTIGNSAFEGCTGLMDVYVSWITPPTINNTVFKNVVQQDVTLHIPHGTKPNYQNALIWRNFFLVDDVVIDMETDVVTTETTVEIEWEPVADAAEYMLIIYVGGEEIARIYFNANGTVVQKTAGKGAGNFTYNLEDLTSGTNYTYTLTAYDNEGEVIAEEAGNFTTQGNPPAVEVENVLQSEALRVYPNPTSNSVTLQPTVAGALIEIYNSLGLRVGTYRASAEQSTLSLQDLPAGIYFIKLGDKTVKIVKQ